jgi:hypothetical protein
LAQDGDVFPTAALETLSGYFKERFAKIDEVDGVEF